MKSFEEAWDEAADDHYACNEEWYRESTNMEISKGSFKQGFNKCKSFSDKQHEEEIQELKEQIPERPSDMHLKALRLMLLDT